MLGMSGGYCYYVGSSGMCLLVSNWSRFDTHNPDIQPMSLGHFRSKKGCLYHQSHAINFNYSISATEYSKHLQHTLWLSNQLCFNKCHHDYCIVGTMPFLDTMLINHAWKKTLGQIVFQSKNCSIILAWSQTPQFYRRLRHNS